MADARIDELRFLARLEREGLVVFSHRSASSDPEVRIVINLLAAGLVNDASVVPSHDGYESVYDPGHTVRDVPYRQRIAYQQWDAIRLLHQGQEVRIYATHAAAVRRAELEQSIVRERLRDSTGILFDARYAERDLQLALFRASSENPLAIGYLDMNGLKQLNDAHDHDAGDRAIRAFFDVIAAACAERGDAYRIGGDEVLIMLPNTSLEDGAGVLRLILRAFGGVVVENVALSAVAGVVPAINPAESPRSARARADQAQYRAKEHSKSKAGRRFGVLALEGVEALEEF